MRNFLNRHPLIILIFIYALIRAISFFIFGNTGAQSIITGILVLSYSLICYKNTSWGWIILMGEFLLDGSGRFLEMGQLLLRTWFLAIFAIIWLIKKVRYFKQINLPSKNIFMAMIFFGGFLIYAIINGLILGNSPLQVVQDAMLYLFLILIFPALDENIYKPIYTNLIKTFIVGTALFSVTTFTLYAAGISVIMSPFYHWFRNIAGGKITDLGQNFFRIVLPEQILIVPIMLVLIAYLIQKPIEKKLWWLMLGASIILTLNFTRIYFIGLGAGMLILLYQENFKRWFITCAIVGAGILTTFFSFYFITSGGQSLGLNLLGVRAAGITTPTADISVNIRTALLPDIWQRIKNHPALGSGLGTTVVYTDPATKQIVKRTQFDWGYLEMITELGILGTISFIILLTTIIYYTFYASRHDQKNSPFYRGLAAGAISLFVINITTPALFQGFGVLYFVLLITAANHAFQQSPRAPLHIS